jgi:hypothetical protein
VTQSSNLVIIEQAKAEIVIGHFNLKMTCMLSSQLDKIYHSVEILQPAAHCFKGHQTMFLKFLVTVKQIL